MIDADLATRLRTAGLPWRPSDGDRFTIPGGELAEDVFVVAEMVIQVQEVPGGASVFKFNGTTEWALDSIDSRRVLWLPREEQLREALGERFDALAAVPGGYAVTLTDGSRHLDIDAERAYARAVLHTLEAT
ncbi:pilus assembly protein CpaE [Micropruina sonneratiae]|uniref:pilus assembly protein CpaE n=1 Tax=Micropruina sonneratiae TaxID=2986940 RepID=UPI00222631CD|nr:pilus assembly protein CpaE [Micropruina sp. KQZ13P-5]MCW3158864.1 pilus assembly protein CpaE [Micropruina sp. KQZ13P-5]